MDLTSVRPEDLFPIAAGLVALGGAFLFLRLGREHYGPEADWWELVRRAVLPQLNRVARRNGWGYAAYTLGKEEYLGNVGEDPEAFEERLYRMGALRMPLAAFKYNPEGRPEVGSWAYREWLFARRQIHLVLFEADDGGTLVYGHEEANAYNPVTAAPHYLGIGYQPLGDYYLGDILSNGFDWLLREVRP